MRMHFQHLTKRNQTPSTPTTTHTVTNTYNQKWAVISLCLSMYVCNGGGIRQQHPPTPNTNLRTKVMQSRTFACVRYAAEALNYSTTCRRNAFPHRNLYRVA